MEEFDLNDFYGDINKLSEKYEKIGSGIEGDTFKINDKIVVKKFSTPREIIVKKTQDELYKLGLKNVVVPFYSLTKKDKVLATFTEYFNAKDLIKDVGEIKFDVLINGTKNILNDIKKMSDNQIALKDITVSSIMYNDNEMKLIDTTQFYKIENKLDPSEKRRLYERNLYILFKYSEIWYSDEWNKIIKKDDVLSSMYLSFEDYGYFYQEMKRFLEQETNEKVYSINDGIEKYNKMNKKIR